MTYSGKGATNNSNFNIHLSNEKGKKKLVFLFPSTYRKERHEQTVNILFSFQNITKVLRSVFLLPP